MSPKPILLSRDIVVSTPRFGPKAIVTPSSSTVIPPIGGVGCSASLTNHPGGTLSGVNLSNLRFTGAVSFGAGDVTLTNCLFAGGLASTYPGHGKITLNYCTNPASPGTGWWFEESPSGSGNPGGHANVFLDHCLFEGGSGGLMQAIRPKGAGVITATDCWFTSWGEPTAGTHTEVVQLMYGASMVATRCAFSRPTVTNNTVTGVLYHESTSDGANSVFTDCVFGGYDRALGTWLRGGGYYLIGPAQGQFIRPTIYGSNGAADAWYSGILPGVLVSPTYITAPTSLTSVTGAAFQALATNGATLSYYRVTSSCSIPNANVTMNNCHFAGGISFGPASTNAKMNSGGGHSFGMGGAAGVILDGCLWDGLLTVANNGIGDTPGPAYTPTSNFIIRNCTLRNYTVASDPEVHSEAIFLGYSDGGDIYNNAFVNNGTTGHLFFTWWSNAAADGGDPSDLYPRNIDVYNNRWIDSMNPWYDIQMRQEVADVGPTVTAIRIHSSQVFPNGVTHPQFLVAF